MNVRKIESGQRQRHQHPRQSEDGFYSVELLIQELKMLYQFKIWNFPSEPMVIVVREDSSLLDQLKVGTVFKSKYYRSDSVCPTVDLETQIKQIVPGDGGRFKGHCLIELAIITDGASQTMH